MAKDDWILWGGIAVIGGGLYMMLRPAIMDNTPSEINAGEGPQHGVPGSIPSDANRNEWKEDLRRLGVGSSGPRVSA